MEQLTSVTGSRHNRSTAASRNRARTRAERLGAFEQRAHKAANGAALRIETSRAWPWLVASAVIVLGSVQPK